MSVKGRIRVLGERAWLQARSSPPLARTVLVFVAALGVVAAGPRSVRAQETPPPAVGGAPERPLSEMDLEELLAVRIVSASNAPEALADAPATVIVLRAEELRERGYRDLSEILDDLPGMEVIRPRGVTYFKNYWRGYRNAIGEPFLVMLDGLVLNHLYFNSATVLATLPLSNVDRVEVVYGPASSVYGPNAFMGVINVITRAAPQGPGSSFVGLAGAGSAEARLADVTGAYSGGGWSLRLSARADEGLDDVENEAYEYTRDRYASDRRLWGGFVDNPGLAGTYHSERRNRALDARLFAGPLEIGLLYNELRTGYGVEYAADREQPRNLWARPEWSLFARDRRELRAGLNATTLVRWRQSDVGEDSFEVIGANGRDAAGGPSRVVNFSFWSSRNSSWSFLQDYELAASPQLSLNGGIKWERKDLQKAYEISYGPTLPVAQLDPATYPFPDAPGEALIPGNRTRTEDVGLYLQGRWRPRAGQQVHLGVRTDRNSKYGSATTVRAGWVGRFGAWTFKALYGDAFQEPSPRLLYGGWTGSGSDPDLQPETSRTIEASAGWTSKETSLLASLYHVRNDDTIVSTPSGAENVGQRRVTGLDVHGKAHIRLRGLDHLRLWGYYSYLFDAEEEDRSRVGDDRDTRIGDLADHKIMAGATASFARGGTFTLRGRWIGERETTPTNPVRHAGSFATFDATLRWQRLGVRGLALSVGGTNLLDETYVHPGVRTASAGETPGEFAADGTWNGSAGFYSSLLPQPGRALYVRLEFGF